MKQLNNFSSVKYKFSHTKFSFKGSCTSAYFSLTSCEEYDSRHNDLLIIYEFISIYQVIPQYLLSRKRIFIDIL